MHLGKTRGFEWNAHDISINALWQRQWEKALGLDNNELSEDISVATGININVEKHRRGKGQGKCSKKKEKGLSNVAEMRNTPRARLEKKVFNPSAMKRVAEKMNVLDSKKFKDKFADQFNYMFNK